MAPVRLTPQDRGPPRRSCEECKWPKKRCSRDRPHCSRCQTQGKECRYIEDIDLTTEADSSIIESRLDAPATNAHAFSTPGPSIGSTLPVNSGLFNLGISSVYHTAPSQRSPAENTTTQNTLNFENVTLLPMLDAEEIRDRWLKPHLMTGTGQAPKHFHVFTVQYLSCVLRSYPGQLLEENIIPPFIHPMQLTRQPVPPALANCSSIVRLWMNRAPGSEELVLMTLKNEIDRLVAQKQSIGDFELLCSFQALLIYMIMAYFFPMSDTTLLGETDIATLQELAFYSAKRGLACPAESKQTRPDWESWIVASAKRRTLVAIYLFINIYNASKDMPSFVSNELADVLVPQGKALWLASERAGWVTEYNRHLAKWEDGMLEVAELWRAPGVGVQTEKRRERIERWVRSADEFGMMLFAVTAHLHGC
ncbi:uncharacterized protein N7496_005495 [Penicillium cataractarum]|uniref:Zn(2)-C6 fungal-type domain-containing protein n=1 Tax=Penicillium cataractarum TaxID=2100454 RepID=A0A9W9VG37_9EURO|nr:uncharacterized protein N7496_005495 [Penicillium cataractarum]KAJ5378086.1 hypothetical protein N7496_005495 [Penicillium cataractarum]